MSKPKILIADDADITRTIIREVLFHLEVELLETTTGNETIRVINKENPDLVLLDISMPGPDGLSILKKMRQTEEFKNTPVIMVTVEDGPECRAEAIKNNVKAYIRKPINLRQLISEVCLALNLPEKFHP